MNKLEKLKGICVRGSEERGAEIIEAFVDAGGMDIYCFEGTDKLGFYCINGSEIECQIKTHKLTEITIDELKEIVYEVAWEKPPKYVKAKTGETIIKNIVGLDNYKFCGDLIVNWRGEKYSMHSDSWTKRQFRLLTSSELAALEKELEVPKVIAGVDFSDSLEALGGLTTKEAPIDRTIYQRLRILGFKKKEFQDEAFFDQNGYMPFQLRKKIDKKTYLVWGKTEPNNEEILFVCDGVIMTKSTVDAVELTLEKLYKQS